MNREINEVPKPRIPLHVDIEFRRSYARQPIKGVLRNISLTGAFLETYLADSDHLRSKDKLNLTFIVSGRKRKINAQVVWHNAEGCGVQFLPTNNRDIQIIDDLIYFVETSRQDQKEVLDIIFQQVG